MFAGGAFSDKREGRSAAAAAESNFMLFYPWELWVGGCPDRVGLMGAGGHHSMS